MVRKKGKRKLSYDGQKYYWYVRGMSLDGYSWRSATAEYYGEPYPKRTSDWACIASEDKKLRLEFYIDNEIPITPRLIQSELQKHFSRW
jgi:hypothetical protein